MTKNKITVKIRGKSSDTAYIAFSGHPSEIIAGVVKKTICLDDLIKDFKGPRVNFDFDKDGVLIGIEILA